MHGVQANYVRLLCSDPKVDRTLLLGETPPKITGGVGGWEVVARPRQVGMTLWQGTAPYELELDVMLDDYAAGVSQEPAIRELLAAARGDDESEPSSWTIRGIPSLPATEWVLNGVEAGDSVIRRADASRVRQNFGLHFIEYVPPEYVQLRARARQGAKGKTTVYTAKAGDTPATIARKRRCKWTDLRTLNSVMVRSANQKLKAGTRLRVPVLKSARKTSKTTNR